MLLKKYFIHLDCSLSQVIFKKFELKTLNFIYLGHKLTFMNYSFYLFEKVKNILPEFLKVFVP